MAERTLLQRMEDWRQGMGVRRFHTWPSIGEQTVGHHSCGVALIIVLCHPSPSTELLTAALTHDLSEGVLGDLPATTKWRSPDLQQEWNRLEKEVDTALGLPTAPLGSEESWCMIAADALEGVLYCREQLKLGNTYYQPMMERWLDHIHEGMNPHWGKIPLGFVQLFVTLYNEAFAGRKHVEYTTDDGTRLS